MRRKASWGLVVGWLAVAGCDKVPLVDIQAQFTLADAAWFAEEETLFVFYRVQAEQGLGPDSRVELTYRTDDVELPWTSLAELPPVHLHLPVDCGSKERCGSMSVRVSKPPSQVGLRLRYHPEGELSLLAPVLFHSVGPGPAHRSRSLLVYGVLDGDNARVQWRARHQFPALRNQEAQELGLRRSFRIEAPAHGALPAFESDNPYGYAFAPECPSQLTALGFGPVETEERARFAQEALPLSASASPALCARSLVTDAKGTFAAPAVARKNPLVRPAFPSLRSPIRQNTELGFVLRPCARTISEPHLAMQVQRMLLSGAPEVCIDNWRDPSFPSALVAKLRARVDEVRAQGKDMLLVIALHHDDTSGQLAPLLERALEQLLPPEAEKSTPRLSGALVFDSQSYTLRSATLGRLVLWCPANLPGDDLEQLPTEAQRSCPLQPDFPDLKLGPFQFSTLPILPTRSQYLTFIAKYSEGQAGQMKSLSFLAPERTPLSQNVAIGEFAVATFFNNEVLTAAPTDVFSYCPSGDGRARSVVFRIAARPEPMPLSALPSVHLAAPQGLYGLGLLWDFPFLTRLEYEVKLAGAASAFSLSIPFGIGGSTEAYYGAAVWQAGEFPLDQSLAQCTRFCDHPTFDSAGVYNVQARFDQTYLEQCYRPQFPAPAAGGFPLDP